MAMKTFTATGACEHCGRESSATYEEPQHDSSGQNTKLIEVAGCLAIGADGKVESRCLSKPR